MNHVKFRNYFLDALNYLQIDEDTYGFARDAYDHAVRVVVAERAKVADKISPTNFHKGHKTLQNDPVIFEGPPEIVAPLMPVIPSQDFAALNPDAVDITAAVDAAGGIENYIRDLACNAAMKEGGNDGTRIEGV